MTTNWTPYHAQYFAYELTQRIASRVTNEGFDDADNLDKLTASLSDAQVDLNPHQVDAALFALRSPLSQGVILADEVGLGKTIEAGIVIAQRWAERKRRILIIAPANLRKQWSQELADKFFLPSHILEKKSFDEAIKKRNLNPFLQNDTILICSFQFASTKKPYIEQTKWDLVIIDEAHRLRNVYRKDNKMGNAIKEALFEKPKILLTATPLQNSLNELYGLVSIVDDYIFGDFRSFKQQYKQLNTPEQFAELKQRIAPVCKRTLRAQVREYVRYTERICFTREFLPYEEEQILYRGVSEYLRKERLYALPNSQRALMTLILRKILASSTFAIADTLQGLVNKLEQILHRHTQNETPTEGGEIWEQDFETAQALKEEWNDDPDFEDPEDSDEKWFSPQELQEIAAELTEIKAFHELAKKIQANAKGDTLVIALEKGFEKMRELGAAEKAVIFTESVRTQKYIREILIQSGYDNKIVLFNGSNNDVDSSRIYRNWLKKNKGSDRITGSRAADIRAALTEHFRDEAQILIATEAAAEGINLQFCSLVVNYDLPWNPQRIEQRIGRCHRYGQRFNVVVINFLNNNNAADKRVYQLLTQKFALFDGVFGASDEVLGAIESGVDFEKRIVQIYQNCRTEEEINAAFDALRAELDTPISERLAQTHQQLIENFDEEVLEKIKVESEKRLDEFENKFWQFTYFALKDFATDFDNQNFAFRLSKSPFGNVETGVFRFLSHRLPFDRLPKNAQVYRFGHRLARQLFETHQNVALPCAEVVFDSTASPTKISALQKYADTEGGQNTGWLQVRRLVINGLEADECLMCAAINDDGEILPDDLAKRFFSLVSTAEPIPTVCPDDRANILDALLNTQKNKTLTQRNQRDLSLFDIEMDKLDRWADDQRLALHTELRDLEQEIKLKKNLIRQINVLAEKIKEKRIITDLEKKLADKRLKLYTEEDLIQHRKEEFLDTVQAKLSLDISEKNLFTIRWRIV